MEKTKKFYSIRSLLSHDDFWFYVVIGSRGRGKTFSAQDYFLRQYFNKGTQFFIIRLSKLSTQQLLANDAAQLFDSVLMAKYGLNGHLKVGGTQVYYDDQPLCKVLALSEAAKQKGVAFFDGNYDGWINILCDEFQREPDERKTFNVLYGLTTTLENLCRTRKNKVRIVMLANQLEQANAILSNWNFLPQKFGRYKLRSKRAIIDYIEDDPDWVETRRETVAYSLMPTASNFTNIIKYDESLVRKRNPYSKPYSVIKFSKDSSEWFTVWEGGLISRWRGERKGVIAMTPYLDERFNQSYSKAVVNSFNARAYHFDTITTQILFETCLRFIQK